MGPEYISLTFWLLVWDWVEAAGTFVVAVAIYGEYLKEYKKYPKDEHLREKFGKWCVWVLIGGVCIELLGHSMGSHVSGKMTDISNQKLSNAIDDSATAMLAAGKANKEAGQANERAANTESNNLVLQSNVLALELEIQPRTISFENGNKLIEELWAIPKTQFWDEEIKIIADSRAFDAVRFSRNLRMFFSNGGFWCEMSSFELPDSEFDEFPAGVTLVDKRGTNQMAHPNPEQDKLIVKAFKDVGININQAQQTLITDQWNRSNMTQSNLVKYPCVYILVGPKKFDMGF